MPPQLPWTPLFPPLKFAMPRASALKVPSLSARMLSPSPLASPDTVWCLPLRSYPKSPTLCGSARFCSCNGSQPCTVTSLDPLTLQLGFQACFPGRSSTQAINHVLLPDWLLAVLSRRCRSFPNFFPSTAILAPKDSRSGDVAVVLQCFLVELVCSRLLPLPAPELVALKLHHPCTAHVERALTSLHSLTQSNTLPAVTASDLPETALHHRFRHFPIRHRDCGCKVSPEPVISVMFIRAQPHQHYPRRQRSVMDNSNSAAATSTDQLWHSPICNNFRDGGAASNTHQRLRCVHICSSSNLSGFSVSDRATGTAATTAVYQPSASATALRAHLPQQQLLKLQHPACASAALWRRAINSSDSFGFSVQRALCNSTVQRQRQQRCAPVLGDNPASASAAATSSALQH